MKARGTYQGKEVEIEVPDEALKNVSMVRFRFEVQGNELKSVSLEPAYPPSADLYDAWAPLDTADDADLPVTFRGLPVDFSGLGPVERAAVCVLMKRNRQLEERVQALELKAAGLE